MVAVGMFMVIVPLLVFYAVGYRFDFASTEQNIRTVGGMYISTDAADVQIFVDDAPVEDMRVFQQAAYVQNITEGMRQVHVQGQGLATWVKDLPVFSHYVTEVRSFNLPVVPQVRILPEWQTSAGEAVLFEPVASTTFANASTSNTFMIATSTATSSYAANTEYEYISTRLASSSEEQRVREVVESQDLESFIFAADLPPVSTSTIATTTKQNRDRLLYKEDGELYVRYIGSQNQIPYYFCVQAMEIEEIAVLYGQHVADSFAELEKATSSQRTFVNGQQWCRDTIRIDRQREEVEWFNFHPELPDVILIKSESGLYGVEIDDRAWQNRQLLYPEADVSVLVDSSAIYLRDGEYVMEVLSELLE